MKDLVIRPIPLYIGPMETAKFTYNSNWGLYRTSAGYIWYIEGAEKRILVDSGVTLGTLEAAGMLGRVKIQDMKEGLAKIKIKPEDIDIVIQTHLHLDHVELAKTFRSAKFVVQKDELEFAFDPHPTSAFMYRKDFLSGLNFEVVQGDQQIVEGVEILLTPGHSPGSQSVLVETKKGKAIITGFCCLEANFRPPGEIEKFMPVISPSVHTDLIEAYRSVVRVKEIADIILPLHEARFVFVDRIP